MRYIQNQGALERALKLLEIIFIGIWLGLWGLIFYILYLVIKHQMW